jgi:CRISPR system Cascade subunit CasA
MAEATGRKKAARATRGRADAGMPDERPAGPLHDLLEDPIFGIRSGETRALHSLPELLALLGADKVDSFLALQAFQQHAWHAFLVQLAAIALHAADETSPRQKAAKWKELLLELTNGKHEPWCLMVGDVTKPAFMQPPVPEGKLDGFKDAVGRPDLLDVLVLSKNHDVKMGRIDRPELEHWVYALVSMQTMSGYGGSGHYYIARMNSGDGSRPGIGLSPGWSLGSRFSRDVGVLLEKRASILGRYEHYVDSGGLGLLWLEPWNGRNGISIDKLDPYFIEVSRRVRVTNVRGNLAARKATSEKARVDAKALQGATGDAWTPTYRVEGKAFTTGKDGFSYRVISRLLGDEFVPGVAQERRKGDEEMLLMAEALVRGDKRTDGFRSRSLPVPKPALRWLGTPGRRSELGALAKERVEIAAEAQDSVLKPALLELVQGGPKKRDYKDDRPRRWLEAFDVAIDAEFFERLWADLDSPPAEARRAWTERVLALARAQLDRAVDEAPIPDARRYRAIAAAERAFEGSKRKKFKHLFDREGDPA